MKLPMSTLFLVIVAIMTLNSVAASQKGKPTPLVCPSPKPVPTTDTYCTFGSGCLDTGWGVNGFAQVVLAGSGDGLSGSRVILTQPDGKVVVAGATWINKFDFFVARFNANGSVDTSFGEPDPFNPPLRKGYVTADYQNETNGVNAAALQEDGSIVVAGNGRYVGWLAARFTSDGELDTSFASAGFATFGIKNGSIADVAVQSDGKLVFAGSENYTVIRLNADGSRDSSFGSSGKIMHRASTSSKDTGRVFSMAIQRVPAITGPEHIVLGGVAFNGTSIPRLTTMRLLPNGALDSSYGTGGRSTLAFGQHGESLHKIRVDGQNRVLAVGTTTHAVVNCGAYPRDILLTRFNQNGSLDTGFGTAGYTVTDVYGGVENVEYPGLELDSSGRIHVVGQALSHNGSVDDFFLVRYSGDGQPDPLFGPGIFGPGVVTLDVTGTEMSVGVAFASDGGIITGGVLLGPVTLFKYFP